MNTNPGVFSSERLRSRRMALGLSQMDAAARLQINQTQYARYENERTTPSLEIAARIAQAFGVSVDWLIGLSDDVQQASPPLGDIESRVLAAFRRQDLKLLLDLIVQDLHERG